MRGHDYHGIKNKPFELFVTGFFDNETDNTVGIRFYEDHEPIARITWLIDDEDSVSFLKGSP
jgi:hypothetical protein